VKLWKRRPAIRHWEIRVTTPEGLVLSLDTTMLEAVWRYGDRSNDGYVDMLQMPRVHLWIKPVGWTEPDRTAALDGTAALPEWLQGR